MLSKKKYLLFNFIAYLNSQIDITKERLHLIQFALTVNLKECILYSALIFLVEYVAKQRKKDFEIFTCPLFIFA